jgi:hypothetical protein
MDILVPALIFPVAFLATAGFLDAIYEGPSTALNYVKSLVCDFPQMFFTIVITYAILRTIVVLLLVRPSICLTFISGALAFYLPPWLASYLPWYQQMLAALERLIRTDQSALLIGGVEIACVGIATDLLGVLTVGIVRQMASRPRKVA